MKRMIKKIITTTIVVGILAGAVIGVRAYFLRESDPHVMVASVQRGELVNSVNTRGVVQSETSVNVFANSGFQIQRINVSVGDKVNAGDLLLIVDTTELESTISERRSMLSRQQETALAQLQNNQRIYNEAIGNFNQGVDPTLVSANSRIQTTENSLENATTNYNDRLEERASGDNAQLINAETGIRSAETGIRTAETSIRTAEANIRTVEANIRNIEIDLENREEDHSRNVVLFNNGAIARLELERSEQSLTTLRNSLVDTEDTLVDAQNALVDAQSALVDAQNGLVDAQRNKETVQTALDREIEQLRQNMETARINHNDAVSNLESTNVQIVQNIDRHRDSLEASQIATNNDADIIAINNLETRLANSRVTAPISGTITAVIAREGANAQGLMFVIEDLDNLMISTRIQEFDSTQVQLGMPVMIRSDATGDEIFEGVIDFIAPTSIKNAQGETIETADVEFETEIKVTSDEHMLRVGMNTRLNIILESISDVYFVPFDAIVENLQDDSFSVVAVRREDYGNNGSAFFLREVPVTVGLETDFFVEVQGDLNEGDLILSDWTDLEEGTRVTVDGVFDD